MFPIFKTHGSLGRSILSYEHEYEIKDDAPVSIFAIAKQNHLGALTVIEDSFLSFPKLYKGCNKNDIQLIFGINFTLCNNSAQKDDDSLLSESKVSVLMKNSQGYKDLIRLHDAINTNVDTFYYIPRGDFSILKQYWTENLELVIPPFDGFIHKNLLNNGKVLPNFGKIKPTITFANMELPWNNILNEAIIKYAKTNKFELEEVHPTYYYKNADFKQYLIFRAINNRKNFDNPGLDFFSSDTFSFESYCNKMGVKI